MKKSIYPIRWSSLSTFWKSPDDWYKQYYLKVPQSSNKYLEFGSMMHASFETDKPLAPVTILAEQEKKIVVKYKGMTLSGTLDGFDPKTKTVIDYKSGKVPWTKARTDDHGQFTMYALLLYLTEGIPPEELTFLIEWIPTEVAGDFEEVVQFQQPICVHPFYTKRTTQQMLAFLVKLKTTVKQMKLLVKKKEL